jgi:hypothetical protein
VKQDEVQAKISIIHYFLPPVCLVLMNLNDIDSWFLPSQQRDTAARVMQRVGLTRIRAECFVRLWVYLLVKQQRDDQSQLKPPIAQLELLKGPVPCTHREATELFYGNKEHGSDRAAGLMLDKLAALGLIKKYFDGNTTCIEILPVPEVLNAAELTTIIPDVQLDTFDPRCDAIPIANLLATRYNWMNRNNSAVPHRIARLLRTWASEYWVGMRVLRRCDNANPVGFYLLYPTAPESEVNFFSPSSKGMHLSSVSEVDPFKMAAPGDEQCLAVFIRSWVIDAPYLDTYRLHFLEDAQQVLQQMQQDFPNLCDLYTLIIHPSYEPMAQAMGFQKISSDATSSVYWAYLAIDRFLTLDISSALKKFYG